MKKVQEMNKYIIIAIIGVVLGTGYLLLPKEQSLGATPSVTFDGKLISFDYTDENVGECIDIRTDREEYSGLGSVEVPVAVTNNCGADDIISFAGFLPEGHTITAVSLFNGNTIEKVWVDDYGTEQYIVPATATTSEYTAERTIVTGKHKEDREVTNWITADLVDNTFTTKNFTKPLPDGFSLESQITHLIPSGETIFAKVKIEFPIPIAGEPKDKEFYLVALGTLGEGILDPTTVFEANFDSGDYSTGDLNGQESWSGAVLYDVQGGTIDTDYWAGDQGVYLSLTNGSGAQYITRTAGSGYFDTGTTTVHWKAAVTGGGAESWLKMYDGATAVGILYHSGGVFYACDGNVTCDETVGTSVYTRWYQLEFAANCTTERLTFATCDDTTNDCTSAPTNFTYKERSMGTSCTTVDKVEFYSQEGGSGNAEIYWDELLMQEPGAAPVAGAVSDDTTSSVIWWDL